MRLVIRKRLHDFLSSPGRADAEKPLRLWCGIVTAAAWKNPADVKATFGKRADFVQTRRTENTVVVFDVAANKLRIIAAVHYLADHAEKGRVYVLRILTHEEYDEESWKDEL